MKRFAIATSVFCVFAVLLGLSSEARAQSCDSVATMACGESDHGRNDGWGSTTEIVDYSCPSSPGGYTGAEYAYSFVALGSGDVTVSLTGLSADLDLVVLSDSDGECDPVNCEEISVESGSSDETITFTVTEGDTYYFVIDGFMGVTSEYDITVECGFEVPCIPTWDLGCGDTDTWNTGWIGSTDVVDEYSCSSWRETGREYVYTFVAPADGSATVSLTGLEEGVDLDIFVLEPDGGTCDPETCVVRGETTATFDITAGNTYYLAVDGYLGAEGDYTINLNCELDERCSPADELECGATVTGSNDAAGSTSLVSSYSCAGDCGTWDESGPEYAYTFIAPIDGDYTASLAGMTDDLDIYILDGSSDAFCDPDACTACGGDSATWTATAGTTYYIVVEGYEGDVSDYELSITCPTLDVCIPAAEVSCGAHVEASTLDPEATDNIDTYSCSTWTDNGPEMAYTFTPRVNADVTVGIHSLTADQDLDIFVIEDTDGVCDSDGCIAYGGVDTTFAATAGTTYYLIVDGYHGDAGDFSLDVDCAFGCAPRLALGCGDMEIGNNSDDGSTDRVDTYSCVGWDESGPEYAYSYTAAADGRVTVTISDMTEDLDIFVIPDAGGDCDPEGCLDFGNNTVSFDAIEGETYYIVVDGFHGVSDDYIIELTCEAPSCDQDLDGHDSDSDGCGGDDCDDHNDSTYTGAEEVCGDGVDQDCDGSDLECDTCEDEDGDGVSVGGGCPAGDPQDCDDSAASIYPGADEVCGDGIDQDCDGADLACACGDRDGDGYNAGEGCTGDIDCNDDDASVHPLATEICGDGIDQDCDGSDLACSTCDDRDGDGYGVGDGCAGADCDDHDSTINPAAEEICGDAIDQDCDGSDLTCATDCDDSDGDGYGDGTDCLGEDCDDDDDEINPEAREICGDGIDQDCDGTDEDCPCDDDDGDGHDDESCGGDDCNDGDADIYPGAEDVCDDGIDNDCDGEDAECACADNDDDGHESQMCGGDDCDDDDRDVYPGASEDCDGIDNNCDGAIDEGCGECEDADGDGSADESCGGDDCDDDDDTVYPSADEICDDLVDNNCNGEIDEGCDDVDPPATTDDSCNCTAANASAPQQTNRFALLLVGLFGLTLVVRRAQR